MALHKKLRSANAWIDKRVPLANIIVNPTFEQKYITTGSTILNLLIGGSRLENGNFVCPGWPKGAIIELYGKESSGKSTIALTAMGHAVRQDGGTGTGVYVDLECAVKDNYAMKLGCDFRSPETGGSGNCLRVVPSNFEEVQEVVEGYIRAGVDLIVIDSIAALVSRRESERSVIKDSGSVAEVPRMMSQWLPKMQPLMAKTGTILLCINQTRDKIGAKGYTEEALKSTVGGNALKFYSTLRVMLQPKESQKAKRWNPVLKEMEEVPVSTEVKVKMVKNKIDAKQGHAGLITLRYGIGMDELRTVMSAGIAYKVIKSEKNKMKQEVLTFTSPSGLGEVSAIGYEKFRLALGAYPEISREMNLLCQNRIIEGLKAIDDSELAELAEGSIRKTYDDDDDDDDSEGQDTPPVTTEAVAGVDYDEDLLADSGTEAVSTAGLEDLTLERTTWEPNSSEK